MKIKDLKDLAYSSHGDLQMAVLYDYNSQRDIVSGCTIEHIVKNYGDLELTRIQAYQNDLILEVRL